MASGLCSSDRSADTYEMSCDLIQLRERPALELHIWNVVWSKITDHVQAAKLDVRTSCRDDNLKVALAFSARKAVSGDQFC